MGGSARSDAGEAPRALAPVACLARSADRARLWLSWDRHGILAAPHPGPAVLEYGATEISPPLGSILKQPARLSHAESRDSRPSTAAPGERRTLHWSKQDSNCRSPAAGRVLSP